MTQASAHAAAWMLAALALTTADECLGLDREFAQAQGRSDFARYPLAVDLPATPGSGKRGLALAQGDVDGDGMPDLVLSLVTAEGEGKLLVYPGNVDYLFPHTAQARARQALSGAPPRPSWQRGRNDTFQWRPTAWCWSTATPMGAWR